MCVACHTETDPNYPSLLLLGLTPDSCGDCHMKPETVDVSWVEGMDKPVHLTVSRAGEANEAALAQAEAMVSEALRARGFRLAAADEAELNLNLVLGIETRSDDRFLKPGTPVRVAVFDMTIGRPGEPKPLARRQGVSKPEWGETGEEAVTRAVRDAWAMLCAHVIEALANY